MSERQDTIPYKAHEKKERLRYRYIFHGSYRQFLPQILKEGFKYEEYYPFLTISPYYAFNFTRNEIGRGIENLRHRARHLRDEDLGAFDPETIKLEDALLLVIEPSKNFSVHATNQGRPNKFTSYDQIPTDLNHAVYSRSFGNPQYEARSKPFIPVGMHHQAKRAVDESGNTLWVDRDEHEKKEVKSGYLNPDAIRLIIPRDEVFIGILSEFRKEMKEKADITDELLQRFKKRIFDYLLGISFEVKKSMSDEDLTEIAGNMIDGELEHLIVERVRSLFLLVEKFKGKKIIKISQRVETEKFAGVSKEEIKRDINSTINKLRKIRNSNAVLMRFIKIYTDKFEKEIS